MNVVSMVKSIKSVENSDNGCDTYFNVKIHQTEELSEYVRRKVQESGLSHKKISDIAKGKGKPFDASQISRIISGETNPKISTLKALAAGLGGPEVEKEILAIAGKSEIDEAELRSAALNALFYEIEDLPEDQRQASIDPIIKALKLVVKDIRKEQT